MNADMPAFCTEDALEDLSRSSHSGIISVQLSLGRISEELEVPWILPTLSSASTCQVGVSPESSGASNSLGLNTASDGHNLQIRRAATDL